MHSAINLGLCLLYICDWCLSGRLG